MKLCGGFLVPPTELCSRMTVCTSMWILPQMTPHLCLLILSSLAVSSQLGESTWCQRLRVRPVIMSPVLWDKFYFPNISRVWDWEMDEMDNDVSKCLSLCGPGLEDVFFSPQDQTVREGEGVFLQCVSGESSPPASISWLKDGGEVTRGRQIQVKTWGFCRHSQHHTGLQ